MRRLRSNQDAIVEQIRNEILSGRLAPGSPLRQETLAADLGVSHIPIREALLKLEAEGLVSITPRCGATVAALSGEEYEELNDMRVALECCVLRIAIPRMTPRDLEAAEEINDRIERQPSRYAELNTAFHLALYEPARRPRILAAITSLLRNDERYIRREVRVAGNTKATQREHRQLLKLIKKGETEEACRLLTDHILAPADTLLADLREETSFTASSTRR